MRAFDTLFPRRCAGCSGGLWPFCERCLKDLTPLTPPWCSRCGRPLDTAAPTCRDCPPRELLQARAPFLYDGPAKAAILKLKFAGWRSVAEALGRAMVVVDPPTRADIVTWVPLGRARLAERGYDQARAIARAVAPGLGIPARRLLRRTGATTPQARRSAEERRTAMSGVFEAGRCPPHKVLLIDDVLTTGATAAECARVLLAAGAQEVTLLTAARAIPGPLPRRYTRRKGSRPGLWLPEEVPR